MAEYRVYKCESCGYTVEANPKGHDRVMMGEIYSNMCQECHEVFSYMAPDETVCPECGSEKIVRWNPIKGKCPKCNHKMKETGEILRVD